jgi:hypothetical protein
MQHDEAVMAIKTAFPNLSAQQVHTLLRSRGVKTRDRAAPVSNDELERAVAIVEANPDITTDQLADMTGRAAIDQALKSRMPKWYEQHFARGYKPTIQEAILEMARKGTKPVKIITLLQEQGYDISGAGVRNFIKKLLPEEYAKSKANQAVDKQKIEAVLRMFQDGWPANYAFASVFADEIASNPDLQRLAGKRIGQWTAKAGIPYRPIPTGIHPAYYDDIASMKASGNNIGKIADAFGITEAAAYSILDIKKARPAPYAGQDLSKPGQKDEYLRWWLSKKRGENPFPKTHPPNVKPTNWLEESQKAGEGLGSDVAREIAKAPKPAPQGTYPFDEPQDDFWSAVKTIPHEEADRRRQEGRLMTREEIEELRRSRQPRPATFCLKDWLRKRGVTG